MSAAPEDLRITIADARIAGHCVRGVKDWFESYNLDFRDFLQNGISARDFLATNDSLAALIVELKLKRESE